MEYLPRKCYETKDDFESYLLRYRNTPLTNIGKAPANLLHKRKLRTTLRHLQEVNSDNRIKQKNDWVKKDKNIILIEKEQ